MSLEIFNLHAPAYWAKEIPVIPLKVMDKRPFMEDWNRFCTSMPTQEEQDEWLAKYKANNIGMPCGAQSKIIVIDYDYDDPKVEAAILSVTKESPWKRVGQRGCVRAYKYNEQINSKKQIFDSKGKIVVEILSNGSQVVLPPSIHPKTGLPYVENCSLLDVLDDLPTLPDDLEDQLRIAIGQVIDLKHKSTGIGAKFKGLDVVPSGARDIQMTRHAGLCAREVLSGSSNLMKAIDDMTAWFDAKVEKVIGDNIDVSKGHRKILEFLINDVTTKNKILPPGWDEGISDEQKANWGLNFDAAHEEWTLQQCLEYVEAANSHAPSSPQRQECIMFMLRKISKSTKLDLISTDQILNALKSDTTMTVASLKKQLRQLKQGPIEGLSHTEIAQEVIKEMEQKQGQMACWNGLIWGWEGSHWGQVDDQTIRNFIQTQFGDLVMSKKFSDHQQIVKVVKDLLPQTIRADANIEGVNFSNGFLNKDMKLLAHNPEFGMIYTLPFSYKPELAGKCPLFLQFLNHCWGDDGDYKDKLMALQEAISATLFGCATSYQRVFLLYGVPNTGKSVLNEIISAIVPDEARCAVSPETWNEPYIAEQFSRKILNVCGELDEKRKLNGKMFKEISSGDEITSRAIYGAPFKFRPRAAHWFASNYLPKSNDVSGGFNRRWLILKFNKVVPPEKIERNLSSRIVYEEIEPIVAWALEGYLRLVKNGNYTLPVSHMEISEAMALQNSVVRSWMSDKLEVKDGNVISQQELFTDFWSYAASKFSGYTINQQTFALDFNSFLGEKGLRQGVATKDGVVYYNFKLKGK